MEQGIAGAPGPSVIAVDSGIELRPVSVDQCANLYAVIDRNRVRLREWLPWASWSFGPDDLRTFIREREADNAARTGLTTGIWLEGRLCGSIGLHAIDPRHRSTSVGYWLDASCAGRGIMTRACRAIVTEGFRNYGLHRMEIRCATGNGRSNAIPRRLGFVEEGILRESEWLHDHWVDLRVFSMLEQDWA
jgi:ribosomal-protein-serine acetyltransferase